MMPQGTMCNVCHHEYDLHYHDEKEFYKESERLLSDVKINQLNEATEAEDIEILSSQLKHELDAKLKHAEEETDAIRSDLINKVVYFESHASIPSYIKLLECQLKVIEQCLKTTQIKCSAANLSRTKKDLTAKFDLMRKKIQAQPLCIPGRAVSQGI